MNGIHFLALPMLNFLWLLPLFIALLAYAAFKRRQALALLIENRLYLQQAVLKRGPDRRWQYFLLVCAVVLLVVGLARPAWNQKKVEVKRQGRDVVFLLDVSRSMLAEDLAPNRLTRAKIAIEDAVATPSFVAR
jgi:Ca-activated chloride channel family protein